MHRAITLENKELYDSARASAFNSVLLKITINFFLLKSVINSYGFKWPDFVSSVTNTLTNLLPTTEQGFSIDCFVVMITKDYSDVYYTRLVFISLKPIIIIIILLLLRLIFKKACKKRIRTD